MDGKLRASCFLGATLFASTVSAVPPSSSAPVEVTLRTPAERTKLTLEGPGMEPRGMACSKPCSFELHPGTYTVYVDSAGRISSVPVHVRAKSDVEVLPPSQSQRAVGIGFVATGGVLVAGGLFAWIFDATRTVVSVPGAYGGGGGSGEGYQSPPWVMPVEIAGGVGVLAILVGVVLITTNQATAEVRSRTAESQAPRAIARQTKLVLATPTFVPGGGGLRLGWRF